MLVLRALTGNVNQSKTAVIDHQILSILSSRTKTES